jgi:hypothetical protein
MPRQEKMGGGGSMADLDREFADRIMRDGKFEVSFVFLFLLPDLSLALFTVYLTSWLLFNFFPF